jgi:hypothetical protein
LRRAALGRADRLSRPLSRQATLRLRSASNFLLNIRPYSAIDNAFDRFLQCLTVGALSFNRRFGRRLPFEETK